MASVNKVIVLGNLGRDPEVRYTASGAPICNLRIATSRFWKDRETGERQEETEWHSVVLYDRLAEIAGEYLRKGRSAYIEGRLKTRKWQDKEGLDRYTTEIIAETLQLLGGRDGAEGSGHGDGEGGSSRAAAPRAPASSAAAAQRPAPKSATRFDDLDDDIPF